MLVALYQVDKYTGITYARIRGLVSTATSAVSYAKRTIYLTAGELSYYQNGNNCYITFRDINESSKTLWINCATGQIIKLIDQQVTSNSKVFITHFLIHQKTINKQLLYKTQASEHKNMSSDI